MPFSKVFIAFLFRPCVRVAVHGACLEGAVSPKDRANVTINGTSMPVGLVQFNWAMNHIEDSIFSIIVEEVLGFNTAVYPAATSPQGLYLVSGCTCVSCPVVECGSWWSAVHFTLGYWAQSSEAEDNVRPHFPELFPEDLGEMGYNGAGSFWILEDMRATVFRELDLPIEYYRSYASQHDLSRFFSGVADIPLERLKPCEQTEFSSEWLCGAYNQIAGDVEGSEPAGKGGCHTRCKVDARWWLAPACRQNMSRCVPWVTAGYGFSAMQMALRAAVYGMPLAIAVAATSYDYVTLPQEFNIAFYWWFPDHMFARKQAVMVRFPPHNEEEWAVDIPLTENMIPVVKWAWHGVDGVGLRRVKETAKRLRITKQRAEAFMLDYAERQHRGDSMTNASYEIACSWLRGNRATWEAWIPLDTECQSGQGLSEGKVFVASRAEASSCLWCSLGRYSAPLTDSLGPTNVCLSCPAGWEQRTSGQTSCTPCRPGLYKGEAGDALCQECPPGNATQQEGQLSCPACVPGKVASEPGQSLCFSCAIGTIAQLPGSTTCSLCDRGTYADIPGLPNCRFCSLVLPGSSSGRGASRPDECICPSGRYMRPGVGCVPCEEGLTCLEGLGEPKQLPGFWAGRGSEGARDYIVYRCRDLQQCPGGDIGTCAPGRHSLACNNCLDLHYPSAHGQCRPCGSTSLVPVLACLALVPAALVLLLCKVRLDASRLHLSLVTSLALAGQMVTAIQALSAVRHIQITWPEHLLFMLDLLSILVFDLEWLRLPCLLSSDSPVSKFVLKLMAYPAFLLLLLLVSAASRLLGRPVDRMVLANCNGLFLMLIYISMALEVMLPFQCRENPGGFLSMPSNPGIRCFEGEAHLALSFIAALGILAYPVGITAWVLHATVVYRARAGTAVGTHFLKRFRFLFARFRPECSHFAAALLLRNLLVATVPILLVRVPVMQVMVMVGVLLANSLVQACFWPWRTALANITELLLGAFLLLLVVGVAVLLNDATEEMANVIGFALVGMTVLTFLGLLGLLFASIYRRIMPKKRFGIFLCHHKAGAGSLCRLLKMILSLHTDETVFLDSDHLDDLDTLFNTVRADVANFVVVLSQKVLARPWCAGEMATAHRNGLPMVPLTCEDFEPPDEEALRSSLHAWSDEEASVLLSYDINVEMVVKAQSHLLAQPGTNLRRSENLEAKEAAMLALLDQCHLGRHMPLSAQRLLSKSTDQLDKQSQQRIVIVGLTSDPEGLAACEVMQMALQKELELEVQLLRNDEEAEMLSSASILLVLWARGILQDLSFARILLAASEAVPHFLTAIADSAFQFPSQGFLSGVAEQGIAGLEPEKGPALAMAYRRLLAVLSRPFDPLRSASAIEEQVKELAGRASRLLDSEARTPSKETASPKKVADTPPDHTAEVSKWAEETGAMQKALVVIDTI